MELENRASNNLYTAKFWQYDSRLGRRWNLDPVVNPSESQYLTFGGNPVLYADPDGLYRRKGRARRMARRAERAGYETGDVYKSGSEWGFNRGKDNRWVSEFKKRRFGDAGVGREMSYAGRDLVDNTWDFLTSLITIQGWKDLGSGIKNGGEIVFSGLANYELRTDDSDWVSIGNVSDAFWRNSEENFRPGDWSARDWSYNLTYGGLTLVTTKGGTSGVGKLKLLKSVAPVTFSLRGKKIGFGWNYPAGHGLSGGTLFHWQGSGRIFRIDYHNLATSKSPISQNFLHYHYSNLKLPKGTRNNSKGRHLQFGTGINITNSSQLRYSKLLKVWY